VQIEPPAVAGAQAEAVIAAQRVDQVVLVHGVLYSGTPQLKDFAGASRGGPHADVPSIEVFPVNWRPR
jgi:hypothetical protein